MVLGQEKDSGIRNDGEDSSGGFDSVERREADVEQNQVRFKPLCLPNRFQPIGNLPDKLAIEVPSDAQRRMATPLVVIVDHENSSRHSDIVVVSIDVVSVRGTCYAPFLQTKAWIVADRPTPCAPERSRYPTRL